MVLGGSIMAVAVLAFTRLRNRPEDMGLLPDGGPPAVQQGSISAFQPLRTRSFWLIACGDGLATTNVPDLTGTALALALSASTSGFTLVGGLVPFPLEYALYRIFVSPVSHSRASRNPELEAAFQYQQI